MKESLQAYRHRMKKAGMKRVEVSIREEDAELIRHVARALAGNDRKAEHVRSVIQSAIPAKTRLSFKEWLAENPDQEEG
ncbi:hypothetical protein [Geminicoccus roseus]|uniref:hypothetical protein n=1 Tax=Geminicoccus roseus TaxID=404900 RepID=UPI000401CB75|nr:hypothetical protein [Geminicoccus roseus]